jgi:hypothetical protein
VTTPEPIWTAYLPSSVGAASGCAGDLPIVLAVAPVLVLCTSHGSGERSSACPYDVT